MVKQAMRMLCPNLDKENGLETVLEVPLPEEMFTKGGHRWHTLMRATDRWGTAVAASSAPSNHHQFMLLLKLVCSAFVPFRAQLDRSLTTPIKNGSIQASTAKYIVHQYLAATGGQATLNGINNMYAMGQVNLEIASDVQNVGNKNVATTSEAGGFVLWQMNPDLWYLELVVSANKICAGSDGKIAWSQSSLNTNASRAPPRPLRRFFQGLDPRSTANLFINTVCTGERTINDENCFLLRLEASSDILKAHSTTNTEILHHTIWGYFSQRTGLLIQFEDSKLIRIKTATQLGRDENEDAVFYETSMESVLDDYRYVDGINIAHAGKTSGTLFRYGKGVKRTWKFEETWRIEEIDFNIGGLSADYFLPPAAVDEHGI